MVAAEVGKSLTADVLSVGDGASEEFLLGELSVDPEALLADESLEGALGRTRRCEQEQLAAAVDGDLQRGRCALRRTSKLRSPTVMVLIRSRASVGSPWRGP